MWLPRWRRSAASRRAPALMPSAVAASSRENTIRSAEIRFIGKLARSIGQSIIMSVNSLKSGKYRTMSPIAVIRAGGKDPYSAPAVGSESHYGIPRGSCSRLARELEAALRNRAIKMLLLSSPAGFHKQGVRNEIQVGSGVGRALTTRTSELCYSHAPGSL